MTVMGHALATVALQAGPWQANQHALCETSVHLAVVQQGQQGTKA